MRKFRPFADREMPAAYEAFAHYRGRAVQVDRPQVD